jgi:AcrR family transcriptional regulator
MDNVEEAAPRDANPDATIGLGPIESVDGRRKRAELNKKRLTQAFIALVAEGVVTPTAQDVARRAGVGLRSVFRHFTDMEALYHEMATYSQRLAGELRERHAHATENPNLEELLVSLINQRAAVYEQLMPFQVAAQAHQHESAFLRAHQKSFAEMQRAALLDFLPKSLLGDAARVEAVDLALSFDTWTRLRREQQLNQAAAKRVMLLTCSALLQGDDGRPPSAKDSKRGAAPK